MEAVFDAHGERLAGKTKRAMRNPVNSRSGGPLSMSGTVPGHQKGLREEHGDPQQQQHQEAEYLARYRPLASNLADGSPSGITLGKTAAADL